MESSLSTSVSALLRNYVGLLPLLPSESIRASEAQARNSASVLFGLNNPNECDETSSLLNNVIEDLTVNIWRLMRAYEGAVWKLPPKKQNSAADVAFNLFCEVFGSLLDKLSAEGMKIVAFEDCSYDPGYKVEVVNGGDYEDEHGLIVSEMLEPIILKTNSGQLVKFGKIRISRKGEPH